MKTRRFITAGLCVLMCITGTNLSGIHTTEVNSIGDNREWMKTTVEVQASQVYCALENPKIATKKITNKTTSIKVKCKAGETLIVENENKQIAKVYYEKEEYKKVKIKKQRAKTNIYLHVENADGDISKTVSKFIKREKTTMEDDVRISKSVKKPIVKTKKLTNKTTQVKVKCKKGQTLYITKGSKVMKKVRYNKTESKTITIDTYKKAYTLSFYTENKNGKRSVAVKRKVKDVTAPKAPVVTVEDDCEIKVKGETGAKVVITYISEFAKKIKAGKDIDFKTEKMNNTDGTINESGKYIYSKSYWEVPTAVIIRLVDKAGNVSEPVLCVIDEEFQGKIVDITSLSQVLEKIEKAEKYGITEE